MKPYSQRNLTMEPRIYNYRHSRTMQISENLFGIVANRWCIFLQPILLSPEKVEDIVTGYFDYAQLPITEYILYIAPREPKM